MKFQSGLSKLGLFVACLLSYQCVSQFVPPSAFSDQVKEIAYASQGYDKYYDRMFGNNWESVRTFRLIHPLHEPLKIYVDTSAANPSLYKPHYRTYIIQSLREWTKALDNRLTYRFVNNAKDADITVHWVPQFEDRYTAGLTVYRVGHARIQIKTVGVPEKDIKANILHEFGHALGIAGHSKHRDDIMVGMRRWQRNNSGYEPHLSQRDIAAIRHLYSLDWQKGEDLYAERAQQIARNKAQQPVTATVQTAVSGTQAVTGKAESREYQPRFIQVLPGNR